MTDITLEYIKRRTLSVFIHISRYEYAALQCFFYGIFNTSATRNFHSHNLYALNVIVFDYFCKLLCIIFLVELGTTDKCYMITNEIFMKISVCVCSTVRCNQKICAVKI